MTACKKIDHLMGRAGIVISILSLFVSCAAISDSWSIARETGGFDRPGIEIGIQGFPVFNYGEVRVVLGASGLSGEDAIAIGSVPFSVRSKGEKSVEDLLVSFQYGEELNRGSLEQLEYYDFGPFYTGNFSRMYSEGGKYSYSNYSLDILNPGAYFEIEEPFHLDESYQSFDVQGESKDGYKIISKVSFKYSVKYAVVVQARDISVISFPVNFSIVKADSMVDMINRHSSGFINEQKEKVRIGMSFWRYLSALIFSSPQGEMYFVYNDQEVVEQDGIHFYGPKGKPEVAAVNYDLMSWALLF